MGDKPPSTEQYEQNSQHQTHTHTHTLRLHLRHHDHTQTRPHTHWQTPHAHNTHTHNTLSVRHHTQHTETTYARKSHQIADTTALLRTYGGIEKASELWFVFDKMQTQIDSDKRLRASEQFLESIGAFREATYLGHPCQTQIRGSQLNPPSENARAGSQSHPATRAQRSAPK